MTKQLTIHILFHISDEATGGGNQFLKSLKKSFQSTLTYQHDIKKADVILFNSHQHAGEVARVKLSYPNKVFVHRIDGPMRLYNNSSDRRDDIVYLGNKYLADATVFQSVWSQRQNHCLGLPQNLPETVISNAPEPSIFNRQGRAEFSTERKIRLIAASWSRNPNKGFSTYQWLDEHLDFEKFEMVFVGNSPIEFKNIRHIPALSSEELAKQLKKSDIFIFASSIEACSNSLLEALHCGLPAVAASGSSNPELVAQGGEIFTQPEEMPQLLEKIVQNHSTYQSNIDNPSIEKIGKKYYEFITHLFKQIQSEGHRSNSFGGLDYIKFVISINRWRMVERLGRLAGFMR